MAQMAHRHPIPVEFAGDNECQGRKVKDERDEGRREREEGRRKNKVTVVEGWKKEGLGDQLKLIRNGYSGRQVDHFTDFPVSRIETISNGTIDMNKVGYVDFIPDSYLLKIGDLLLSNINSLKHIGKVAQVAEGTRLFHGMNLLVLRPVEQVDDKFLFYKLINAKPWFEKMAAQAINQASINQTTIKDLQLDLPQEKLEQAKIAEILSTVDRTIEQTEALIAKQQRIKTGLMQDLLTRGIDAHSNLRSEKTHKFKDSPLGRIPAEWDTRELGTVSFVTKLAGFEFTNYFDYRMSGDIIALRALNIKDERLDLTDIQRIPKSVSEKLPRSKIHADDILITYIGAYIGEILRIEENDKYHLAPNIAKIVSGKLLVPRFLEAYLRLSLVQRQIKSLTVVTATPSLTMTQIRKLLVAVPRDKKEQVEIALRIRGLRNALNYLEGQSKKLHSLKTSLMQDLLTGRKRVTSLMTDGMGLWNDDGTGQTHGHNATGQAQGPAPTTTKH